VYDSHYEEIQQETLRRFSDHPEIGPLIHAIPAEQREEQSRASRELLRRAMVEGEWEPYFANLRSQGAFYARMGLTFRGWYEVVSAFRQLVVPDLLDTYRKSPQRLFAAILAMSRFIDVAMENIGEAYLSTKEEIISRQNEELQSEITERKRIEQQILLLNANLQNAVKELEAFSYSVSHDLRAPLRSITGFSNALLEDYGDALDEGAKRYLQLIQSSADDMGRLIDNLLAFSRMGRRAMEYENVSMTRLARSVFDELRHSAVDRKLELKAEAMPNARGDRAMVRQVFANLFSNAIKFTAPRETATIEVGARTENGETVYYVKDNGVGFDMRYANKLFGVFQRLHRADQFEGTGVGLAIVQRIVHRHGGRVWAEGKVNEGATFYFTLSAQKGAA
jgi:signal transduction histidine kinase